MANAPKPSNAAIATPACTRKEVVTKNAERSVDQDVGENEKQRKRTLHFADRKKGAITYNEIIHW